MVYLVYIYQKVSKGIMLVCKCIVGLSIGKERLYLNYSPIKPPTSYNEVGTTRIQSYAKEVKMFLSKLNPFFKYHILVNFKLHTTIIKTKLNIHVSEQTSLSDLFEKFKMSPTPFMFKT